MAQQWFVNNLDFYDQKNRDLKFSNMVNKINKHISIKKVEFWGPKTPESLEN